MTTRRGFLGAMLAACAAPAIVRADSLMRVIPVDTEILLPKPARSVREQMQEANQRAIDRLREEIDADIYQATVQCSGHGMLVGDVIQIADVYSNGGSVQRFRVTAVEGSVLTVAHGLPPAAPAAAVVLPWNRQHQKRGRP